MASGPEGCGPAGCKACDPSTGSGQAETTGEEVYPEPRASGARGRLVAAKPCLSRAKTDRA